MSLFLVHQTHNRVVALTDSLLSREHRDGAGTFHARASKLVAIGSGVYACHAGTWQPALSMLADLATFLRSPSGKRVSYEKLLTKLKTIGTKRHAEFVKRFKRDSFDVRIALILTGRLRNQSDRKDGYASTILIWEKARDFAPHRSRGQLYFAGNPQLSNFATCTLDQPLLQDMLNASPLSAAQALLAAHAAIARISALVSHEANVAIIDSSAGCCIIDGQIQTLPHGSVLEG